MSRTILASVAASLCRRVHFLPNKSGGCKWISSDIAFPKSYYSPTSALQRCGVQSVTLDIRINLCTPVSGVRTDCEFSL
jgi:hypothetical protein